ncbi:globin domain-containing protein [Cryptosporangium phraense]|nr:globin domain-containing protein [Cryptosporangium phraense]
MIPRLPDETRRPDAATMALLRESRAAIAARPVDLAAAVYRHLPSFAPRTKELMAATVRSHGERIVEELLRAVEVLDALAVLSEDLRKLGAEHAAEHGVPAEHYPYVGQALVRAVRELFPDADTGPVGSAWLEVYEWVAAEMLAGAVEGAPSSPPGRDPESSPAYWRPYIEPLEPGESSSASGWAWLEKPSAEGREGSASGGGQSSSRAGAGWLGALESPEVAPVWPGAPSDVVSDAESSTLGPAWPVAAGSEDGASGAAEGRRAPLVEESVAEESAAGESIASVEVQRREASAAEAAAGEAFAGEAFAGEAFAGEAFARAEADSSGEEVADAENNVQASDEPIGGEPVEAAGWPVAAIADPWREAAAIRQSGAPDGSGAGERPGAVDRATAPSADAGARAPEGLEPGRDLDPVASTVPFNRGELLERLARADEIDAAELPARPVSPVRPVSPARPGPSAGPVGSAAVRPVSPARGGRHDVEAAPSGRGRHGVVDERAERRRGRNPWAWGARFRSSQPVPVEPAPPQWQPPALDPAMYDSPPEVVPSGPQNLDFRRPAPGEPTGEKDLSPTGTAAVGESAAPPEAPSADPVPPTAPTSGARTPTALRGVGTGWPRTTTTRPVRPAAPADDPRGAPPDPLDLGDAPAQE